MFCVKESVIELGETDVWVDNRAIRGGLDADNFVADTGEEYIEVVFGVE